MSANGLVPDEYQARLLQVRGSGDAEFWTIGDVAAELCDAAEGIKKTAIRIAVAAISGVKESTVRDYEECARYYPSNVRGQYPNLTRWHFRHAKRVGDLIHSMQWLNYCVDSASEYGGMPMPVDVLCARMNKASGTPGPSLSDLLLSVRARLERIAARPDAQDDPPARYIGAAEGELDNAIAYLVQNAKNSTK